MRKADESARSDKHHEEYRIDYGLEVFSWPSTIFTAEELIHLTDLTAFEIKARLAQERLSESLRTRKKVKTTHADRPLAPVRKSDKQIKSDELRKDTFVDYGLDVFSWPSSVFTAEQLSYLKFRTVFEIKAMKAEEQLTKSLEAKGGENSSLFKD